MESPPKICYQAWAYVGEFDGNTIYDIFTIGKKTLLRSADNYMPHARVEKINVHRLSNTVCAEIFFEGGVYRYIENIKRYILIDP